jgi:tRNA 2-thiouridine synthesizing protein C
MTSGDPTARDGALVILSHAPYEGNLARSALDTVLAAAAFEQPVALLLLGAAVLMLLPGQDGQRVGKRTPGKIFASLSLYDVDPVYVDVNAVSDYGIGPELLPAGVRLVDTRAQRELIDAYRHVLGF